MPVCVVSVLYPSPHRHCSHVRRYACRSLPQPEQNKSAIPTVHTFHLSLLSLSDPRLELPLPIQRIRHHTFASLYIAFTLLCFALLCFALGLTSGRLSHLQDKNYASSFVKPEYRNIPKGKKKKRGRSGNSDPTVLRRHLKLLASFSLLLTYHKPSALVSLCSPALPIR
ncbi:hypothetical protein F4811DRAFT_390177 [Daldinia bambusicola]|nr:hypothetical protein F4811DRAFT_390177 [Daldinia bambusicola]